MEYTLPKIDETPLLIELENRLVETTIKEGLDSLEITIKKNRELISHQMDSSQRMKYYRPH